MLEVLVVLLVALLALELSGVLVATTPVCHLL